ncbi:uncharacterized protein LOC144945167 [Lampetra fluviatilis]
MGSNGVLSAPPARTAGFLTECEVLVHRGADAQAGGSSPAVSPPPEPQPTQQQQQQQVAPTGPQGPPALRRGRSRSRQTSPGRGPGGRGPSPATPLPPVPSPRACSSASSRFSYRGGDCGLQRWNSTASCSPSTRSASLCRMTAV